MSTQYYELYLADVLSLAKSLTIKSEATATAINNELLVQYPKLKLSEDSREWKYYLNLAGEYFSTDTDYLTSYNFTNGLNCQIEKRVYVSSDILTNEFFDLSDVAYMDSFVLKKSNGTLQVEGTDYTIDYKGGVNGKTRITLLQPLLSSIALTNNLFISYRANNGKIVVISIDTLEPIEFTKENLIVGFVNDDRLVHRATAKAYAVGSRYYTELVRRYPDQELLIRGILNPIPIDDILTTDIKIGNETIPRIFQTVFNSRRYFYSISGKNGNTAQEQTTPLVDLKPISLITQLTNGVYDQFGQLVLSANDARGMNSYGFTLGSIDSKDHQILYYNPDLVEDNELSLISKLQDWIYKYFIRWDVSAYGLIDSLYVPTCLGILWLNLPCVILNLRLAACKTREAHSYHIRQYLASHDGLDIFMDYMTKKQSLFLYRNIRYIQRNAGKIETFNWLVKNILTDRAIPLNAWNLNHNVESIGENLSPVAEMILEPINDLTSELYSTGQTVEEILLKELDIAKDNLENLEDAKEYTEWAFTHNRYSQLNSKVLESSMVDYNEAQPYKKSEVLLNHWAYLSFVKNIDNKPRYQSTIILKHPNTGEDLNISALNAFILFIYAFNQGTGLGLENKLVSITNADVTNQHIDLTHPVKQNSITFWVNGVKCVDNIDYVVSYMGGSGGNTRIVFSGDYASGGNKEISVNDKVFIRYHFNGGLIPHIKACRVRKIELPTVSDLMRLVDNSKVDVSYAEAILANQPSIDSYVSIESFYELCSSIHENVLYHRRIHAFAEDMYVRGYTEQMVDYCYQDLDMDIGNGKTFEQWFADEDIDIKNLADKDWMGFASDILNVATGASLNTVKTLRSIQEAMINMMSKLSSYSVQFLKSMIDNLILLDWICIRFNEDVDYEVGFKREIEIIDIDVNFGFKAFDDANLDLNLIGTDIDCHITEKESFMGDITIDLSPNATIQEGYVDYVPMSTLLSFEVIEL